MRRGGFYARVDDARADSGTGGTGGGNGMAFFYFIDTNIFNAKRIPLAWMAI
jgi:hypothetical protein